MNITEKIRSCAEHGEIMPLKGHAQIILRDKRDGTIAKRVESDNMVTNAAASIFSKNYSGLGNFGSMLPLWEKMYSGVLCFQNTLTETGDNYFPPSDLVSPLVAHAGNLANNTGSLLRGSPVTADFEETDTSIKQVWSWPATHGNGTISCVCLCPPTLGNMGLKPYDDEFNPISSFGSDTGTGANTYDETEAIKYPFNIDDSGKYAYAVYMNGTSFKEIKVRHDYFAFGIMRSNRDWQEVTTRTATIRAGSSGGNRIVFDDASYYYVAQAYYDSQSSKYGLYIDKIDKSTFTVTQADIQYADVTLYTGTIYEDTKGGMRTFGFDGTYLYFPNNAGTGFVKLNIADANDKMVIDGTISIGMGRTPTASDGRQFMPAIAINSGLILGSNYIINGARAYEISHVRQISCGSGNYGNGNYLFLARNGAATYGNTRYIYSGTYRVNQNAILNEMALSTINNIEPVVKSTSLSMEIIYTLQEI